MYGASLLALAHLFAAQGGPPSHGAGPNSDESRCGSRCLRLAVGALGPSVPEVERLESILGAPGPEGYSMAELVDAGEALGLGAIAVETSAENLRERRRPFTCVALLKSAHFVVLYDLDDGLAHVVDPPRSYSVPLATFEGLWTGKAVILGEQTPESEEAVASRVYWRRLGRNAILGTAGLAALGALYVVTRFALGRVRRVAALLALTSGAAAVGFGCGETGHRVPHPAPAGAAPIRVTPPVTELGDVARARPGGTTATATIQHAGGSPLRITALRQGCSCLDASVDRNELGPGEAATLTVVIDLGDSPDERQAGVEVVSNAPAHPVATAAFRWRAIHPLVAEPGRRGGRDPRLGPGARRRPPTLTAASRPP